MTDAYSQQEYLDLMDRFKKEKIPLSVGVLDIDW
jgi:alpha-glucosidase (family GH31 glycosyl hydrolase)